MVRLLRAPFGCRKKGREPAAALLESANVYGGACLRRELPSRLMVLCPMLLVWSVLLDSAAAQSTRFSRATVSEGDRAAQTVAVRLEMDVTVHLGAQEVQRDATRIDRAQERTVRLTRVVDGRSIAGEVTYHKAEEVATGGTTIAPTRVVQPVEGKTYRVMRVGEELSILDADGQIPPLEEYEIAWQNMESFGKPNPLAQFLDGRTVKIGETLELPGEAARRLLAFGDEIVNVEQFSLRLRELPSADRGPLAVFDAAVQSRSHGRGQMGMQIEGTIVVEAASCRVTLLELAGPIGLTDTQTNGPDTYLISGRGKLHVAMRGEFAATR